MLLKTSTCIKGYDDETKWMNYFVANDNLFKKDNYIWNKASNRIDQENLIENLFTLKNCRKPT